MIKSFDNTGLSKKKQRIKEKERTIDVKAACQQCETRRKHCSLATAASLRKITSEIRRRRCRRRQYYSTRHDDQSTICFAIIIKRLNNILAFLTRWLGRRKNPPYLRLIEAMWLVTLIAVCHFTLENWSWVKLCGNCLLCGRINLLVISVVVICKLLKKESRKGEKKRPCLSRCRSLLNWRCFKNLRKRDNWMSGFYREWAFVANWKIYGGAQRERERSRDKDN